MIGPRVGPNELGEAQAADLAEAMEAARWLESAADEVAPPVNTGFSDRVMAAIAGEPSPAVGGFLVPVRRRGFVAGFADSVRQAWASLGAGRPMLARSAALAYVLVVAIAGASITGAAAVGAAGLMGVIGPDATQTPTPIPVPDTQEPSVAPEPTIVPSPTPNTVPPTIEPTPSPSESPDESDDDDGSSGPGGGGDDDNSGPGSSDSGGDSEPGGDSGSEGDDDSSGPGSGGSGSGRRDDSSEPG